MALIRLQGGATDTLSLWINPDLSLGEAGLGTANLTHSFGVFNDGLFLKEVSLVSSTNTGNPNSLATFDEIRVGTSFDDASVIPEPGTLILFGLGLSTLLLLRRRR